MKAFIYLPDDISGNLKEAIFGLGSATSDL